METLLTCLNQRVILMTEIMDLTKQIEVQSKQEEPQIDHLLHQRKVCMNRIDKCNALITKKVEELSKEGHDHLSYLLDGEQTQATSDEEFQIYNLVQTYQEFLQLTIAIDANAVQMINERREFMKGKINNIRFAKGSDKLG